MAQIDTKARLVFLLFNILYFMLGAGMFGVGIYNIISIRYYENFAQDVYITGGVLFVLVGVAKIIISIMGIIGWGTGWKILLVIYGIIAVFLILPTLAAGIFGLQQWYFVFDEVGNELRETYASDSLYESTTQLRRDFREEFNCCGIKVGLSDYDNNLRDQENCTAATNFRKKNLDEPPALGCQYYISDAIKFHLYYIGAIGLGFGFFELTAAIVAMQNLEGI